MGRPGQSIPLRWGVFDGLTPAELAAQDEEEDAVADPRRELFLDVA